MKRSLAFLFAIFTVAPVFGQTKVSGKVTDMKGEPVNLANIVLYGTYEGTSSDATGSFEFITSEQGLKELQVTFVGFRAFVTQIELKGRPVFVSVQLQDDLRSLDAVTISAGSFTAGDQSRITIFNAIDIATTAGATADIAGALNTLPGTQKAPESGRLFVRGGDGSETRTFIDGHLVLDAYSPSAPDTPSRGRFLPFMFKGTSFSTGGYSAEYGQALSSALVLDSKDQAEITRTDFGLLSVGADVGHTQVWEKTSVAAKLQYTNIHPYYRWIKQNIAWRNPPQSLQAQAAFRQQSGKRGLLKVYANFDNTNFSLYTNSPHDQSEKHLVDVSNRFHYLNGLYKSMLGEHWLVKGGWSWTDIYHHALEDNRQVITHENGLHGKAVFEGTVSKTLELKSGLEIIDRKYSQKTTVGHGHRLDERITSAFVEADQYITNQFIARTGVRLEFNALSREFGVDPRMSLGWRPGRAGQISLAYGKFRQSPRNELLLTKEALQSEKADHYILTYQLIENNRTFRVEGYYKRYTDLVRYNNSNDHQVSNTGYGFANGLEVFWRDNKSVRHVDYWVSWSFLHTKRKYLHYPIAATPNFASKHNISAVYKHFIPRLRSQLGLTWSYTSGRPYNDPNTHIFNGSSTPAYVDLSFNWSYLPTRSLIIYFSCTNLTGRKNIFGYEFIETPNADGVYDSRTIGQPAKRFLFVGLFITLSKEKSVNQLPNL